MNYQQKKLLGIAARTLGDFPCAYRSRLGDGMPEVSSLELGQRFLAAQL
jgi:hypothetical protein